MIPALQASALAAGRTFVAPADVEAIARHVFCHRLELTPGADPVEDVLAACMKEPMEQLARAALRRR
jgi:MoxR-like ATPase